MDTSKDTEKDLFDIDIRACSTMGYTRLVPSLPQNDAERESYEDLYPYITEAQKVDEDAEG